MPASSSEMTPIPRARSSGRSSRIFPALLVASSISGHRRRELGREHGLLRHVELAQSFHREIEQQIQLAAIERPVLSGPLHLYEATFAAHHDVHVDGGTNVFFILEVEARR